jgi:hypothetical protein
VIIYLNSINQLIFVMVKSRVFFAVRTEFLKCYLDELRLQRANHCSSEMHVGETENTGGLKFIYINN